MGWAFFTAKLDPQVSEPKCTVYMTKIWLRKGHRTKCFWPNVDANSSNCSTNPKKKNIKRYETYDLWLGPYFGVFNIQKFKWYLWHFIATSLPVFRIFLIFGSALASFKHRKSTVPLPLAFRNEAPPRLSEVTVGRRHILNWISFPWRTKMCITCVSKRGY